MTYLISWCFLLYFLILGGERIQSLVRYLNSKDTLKTGFDWYVTCVAILSVFTTIVMLLAFNASFWRSLIYNVSPNYTMLCITACVLLISGMVHTNGTIAPLQFGAYGVLILAMILKTVQFTSIVAHPFVLWFSLLFVIAFSMAIPVVYHSDMENALLFHIVEAVVSIALVASFTILLVRMFTGTSSDLLMWIPMILCVIGDAAVLYLRKKETINKFVLIFALASVALFVLGKIIFALIK